MKITQSLKPSKGRNNIPEDKSPSFGDKSSDDDPLRNGDSFKSESLGSPSPKNQSINKSNSIEIKINGESQNKNNSI